MIDARVELLVHKVRTATLDQIGKERFALMNLIIPEGDLNSFADALVASASTPTRRSESDSLRIRDLLREAFRPFAEFMEGDAFGKLPGDLTLTSGSSLARQQLTANEFRKLAGAIKLIFEEE